MFNQLKLRPLEREDLPFVHRLNNDAKIMSYWFEEPYETFVELQDLFDKHIHDQSERRFIIEKETEMIGLVELVEIDYIHR
ncbi:spermidine acetyltransferase, partial [Bacillus amyloliquefaciens]